MDTVPVPDDLPRAPLAGMKAFRAGPLHVQPALLTVSAGENAHRLEPRVMHVLVVLNEARGEVVSRDALIARCWGRRVVTEDSVQRCVTVLRKLARSIEPAPFAIETIPKVGYRLIAAPPKGREAGIKGKSGTAQTGAPPVPRRGMTGKWVPVRLVILALAAMAAAMGAVSGQKHVTPDHPVQAVAILPLEVIGGAPELEPFARAWPYALANDLKAAGIPVAVPRREARATGRGRPGYFIDGAAMPGPAGGEIIVRIGDERSGEILWSKAFTFSAAPEQVRALMPEISAALSAALNGPGRVFRERRGS
jgi:DNA-binding winged helix-turn-helix (wHTH) protein